MCRSAVGAVVSQAKRDVARAALGKTNSQDSRPSPRSDRRRDANPSGPPSRKAAGPAESKTARSLGSKRARRPEPQPARRPEPAISRAALGDARPVDFPAPQRESQVVEARAGDHPSIYQWLLAVFHAPSREEFYAEQDDPTYEPVNRLLVKRGPRIVSHAQLLDRTMHFGSLRLPVSQLAWLGTLPEFRRQGAASRLLTAADERMCSDGAALGLLRTRVPRFFHRAGWAVCGRHCFSRANPREILARYWAGPELRRDSLNIRLWRHFELPALMRIYAQNTAESFGPLQRDEAYWRWLISRAAFDHIIIALAGPDRLDLNETAAPIVGYAVVRQERIVELLTNPAYPTAGVQLLARACSDALERRGNDIVFEGPAGDPLHQFIQTAGGALHHHEADEGEVFMAKLVDSARFFERLAPIMEARFRAADSSKSCELGLLAGCEKFLLTIDRGGARIARGRLGRSYLTCTPAELTRLLLGHSSPADAAAQGRLSASTQLALELAGILFPRLPAWRPLWDDLAA